MYINQELIEEDEPYDVSVDSDSLILDIEEYCATVQNQQAPRIRLETLSTGSVHRMILCSYLIFAACVILAAFPLPTHSEVVPLNGLCGSPKSLVECNKSNEMRFYSRAQLALNIEDIQVVLESKSLKTPTLYEYDLHIRDTLVKDPDVYLVSHKGDTLNVTAKQPGIGSSIAMHETFFLVQMEFQFNLWALRGHLRDCSIAISFRNKSPFRIGENVSLSIVVKKSNQLIEPIVGLVLSFLVAAALVSWGYKLVASDSKLRLPQRLWMTYALIILFIYDNPLYCVWNVVALSQGDYLTQEVHFLLQSVQLTAYLLIMLWMLVMSTGVGAATPLTTKYFLPKIIFVLVYGFIFIVAAVVFAFNSQGNVFKDMWALFMSTFQCFFYIYIISRTFRTWKLLRRLPYAKSRFQQLPFRVFLLQSSLLLVSILLQYAVMIIAVALGYSSMSYSSSFIGKKIFIHVIVFVMAYCFLDPLIGTEDAATGDTQYVVLEKDIHMRAVDLKDGILEQVSSQVYDLLYQRNGRRNFDMDSDVPLVFCIETAVSLLNMTITCYYDPMSSHGKSGSSFGFHGVDVLSPEEQGYTLLKTINCNLTDTHVMIVHREDRLVIAFRGTGSKKNVVTDLRARQVVYKPACIYRGKWNCRPRVHSGFWKAYLSIRNELLEFITTQAVLLNLPIYCTGHSLGAALATLAAIDFHDCVEGVNRFNVTLYNFGSPRVGNHAFAQYFNERVVNAFRVVCDGDVVTGLPKRDLTRLGRSLFGTYKHVGTEVVIDPEGNGNLMVKPSFVEKKFSMKFRGSAKSHYLKAYRIGFRGLSRSGLNYKSTFESCGGDFDTSSCNK